MWQAEVECFDCLVAVAYFVAEFVAEDCIVVGHVRKMMGFFGCVEKNRNLFSGGEVGRVA